MKVRVRRGQGGRAERDPSSLRPRRCSAQSIVLWVFQNGGHLVRRSFLALTVLTFPMLAVGTTARLFVWPRTGAAGRADAVVVLSGDHGERLATAMGLMHDLSRGGVPPVMVLDGQPDFQLASDLCLGGHPFEVVCLRPRPDSTAAEARAAGRLSSERGWQRVVVVTSTSHVTRAGLLFRRCLTASVTTVIAHRRPSPRDVVHEWLGLGKALVLARSC
jgi:uncharacterized SAM-binding protein YcdF (DUF218 family)